MSAASCPFPGCALALEHDGDHLPAWRCVQRFRYAKEWGIHCEVGDCQLTGVALYTTHDGRGLIVCLGHEATIPKAKTRELEAIAATGAA